MPRKPKSEQIILIGREQEREKFAQAIYNGRKGLPTLLLFEADPGSGKTALMNALQKSVSGRNLLLARVDLAPGEDMDPLVRAAEIITHPERFQRLGGRRRVRYLIRKLLPEWIGAIPILGDLLGAIAETIRAVRKRRAPAEKRPSKYSEEMEALENQARRRPVAIFIDEFQLMSEAAADRLLRLLSNAQLGMRLLVVGTVGPVPPGAGRPITRIFHERLPADRLIYQRLGPLARAQIVEWLNARFENQPLPERAIDFLIAGTGGQPGAVQALLDRLLASGALQRNGDVWSFDEATADDQLEVDTGAVHLGNLRPEIAEAVLTASIFGDEFDALDLARVLEVDELELEDRLAVAVRHGLLGILGEHTRSDGEFSTRFRFGSPAVRAALHRSLPQARRRELEARIPAR